MTRPAKHAGRLLALGVFTLSSAAGAEENASPAPVGPPAAADQSPHENAAPEPAPPAVVAPKPATPPQPQPLQTVLAIVPAPPPTDAAVHIAANYTGAWLEGRGRVDKGEWQRLCRAPCDRTLRVEGLELRMTAPSMTASNPFVIDPGPGTARLRLAGGSSTARNLGIYGLAGGLLVSFGGMTLFGLGSLENEQAVRTAGIVTLAVGATAIVVALPLLLIGSTAVRNEKGAYIAKQRPLAWTF